LQAGLLLACKGREAVFPPQEIREARAGVLRVQMGKAPRHVLRRPEMAAGINLRAPAGFRRRGGIDILVKDALGGIIRRQNSLQGDLHIAYRPAAPAGVPPGGACRSRAMRWEPSGS